MSIDVSVGAIGRAGGGSLSSSPEVVVISSSAATTWGSRYIDGLSAGVVCRLSSSI